MTTDASANTSQDRRSREFTTFYRQELATEVRRATLLVGSPALAADLVHDAFVEVYRRWEHITEPGPYLHRCVINGCRDATRRTRRAPVPDDVGAIADHADDIAVWSTVLALPFRQRAAVVMRYWQGKTEHEIATALNCRTGTVGSLLTRAKRALESSWNR